MKIKFNIDNLSTFKGKELLPLECEYCNSIFNKPKNEILKVLTGMNLYKNGLRFCSKKCRKASSLRIPIPGNCECCGLYHDGKHTSGRFCSLKCSRSFSTKNNKEIRNKKISEKISLGEIEKTCPSCNNIFKTKKSKNSRYCSIKCGRKNKINKGYTWTDESKNKLSISIKLSYAKGKEVYGGRTKWYEIPTSIGLIKVQGSFEYRACKILDIWKDKEIISNWEYTKDRIEYIGLDEKIHSYLLDFKIYNNDGSWYYLETKGFKRDIDKNKWKSVIDKGYKLIVWFKKNLEKEEEKYNIIPFIPKRRKIDYSPLGKIPKWF
jgi:hypothetical protein